MRFTIRVSEVSSATGRRAPGNSLPALSEALAGGILIYIREVPSRLPLLGTELSIPGTSANLDD